jgi:DNA invertase Pin-like site-specific DNA recombinase
MTEALAGRFEVLLVESLDRLSRNLVEQESAIRRLEHRGIRLIGVSDGYDTNSGAGRKLLRSVRGLTARRT